MFIQDVYQEFKSSCGTTNQWKNFYRKTRNEFKKALPEHDLEMSKGHFFFTGFFTSKSGQIFYFSVGDVRWFDNKMLIRKADHYKDYTGHGNQYINVDENFWRKLNLYANS